MPAGTRPHNYSSRFEIERLRALRPCLDRVRRGGRSLIEFGCNAGMMTQGFADVFDSVVAIDYDAELVRQARERVGAEHVEFMQYDLNDDLPDRLHGRFDAAFALEVIEHLNSPEKFIQQIRRCLRTGGRLVISSPNTCSPEAITGRFLGARDGIDYTAWDSTHVSLFGAGHLTDLLKRNGFDITRVTGYYYGFTMPKTRSIHRVYWSTRLWPLNRLGFVTIVEARVEA